MRQVGDGGGAAAETSARLLSLDAFRGLTLAAMVVVNNPGSWSHVYGPLKHADWHGWTPTDLIFPFFVFIVGVAIPFSLQKYLQVPGQPAAAGRRAAVHRILRRSALIFLISLIVLHGYPYTLEKFRHIRIPGVLQRIAICYAATAGIYLVLRVRGQLWLLGGLLLFYWGLLMLVPAPGFAAGDLSREGNLPAWVDRTLLRGHTYKPDYDPEGLLSTLPAIATCLSGLLAGTWLRSGRTPRRKAAGLVACGAASVVLGLVWDRWFPINKPLWTSSYVALTSGMALLGLAACYWVMDVRGCQRWSLPFRMLGANALAVFVLSGLTSRVLSSVTLTVAAGPAAGGSAAGSTATASGVLGGGAAVAGSPTTTTLKAWLYEHCCTSWLSPINASLFWSLLYLLFWLGVAAVLYRCRWFLRV